MSKSMIAGGCVAVLVALGFVFPQIAAVRNNGAISPGGIVLLLMGVAGTLGGVWCIVRGMKRGPSTPAS